MARLPLDLSKFKKISSDKKITVLRHEDGHEIRLAHNALSDKVRNQLDSLKSEVNVPRRKILPKKMADGGEVEDAPSDMDSSGPDNQGGFQTVDTPKQGPLQAERVLEQDQESMPKIPAEDDQAGLLGSSIPPQEPQDAGLAAQAQEDSSTPPPPSVQSQGVSPTPTLGSSYEKQLKGIDQQANASAQMAMDQSKIHADAIKNQQQAIGHYQASYNALNKERLDHIKDVKANRIDPEAYWKNHSKVNAAIGIMMAGFNPTNRPNGVVEYLNKQIDDNIKSQEANLNSEHSLLKANMQQFGNLKDATNMTRIMQADLVTHQLQEAAAKATSPMAKARALQAAGQLEAQYAPMFQQLAVRQTLQSAGSSGVDPTAFIPHLVPKEHQAAAFKEVERAQDTKKMAGEIMHNFDQAVMDTRGMGRVTSVIKTPRSSLALHQALQPTFKDLEGTVRQAAMDNTFNNVTPSPIDTDKDIATKRQALQQYLQSKSSAPIAKAYGIDLDHFKSTTSDPVAQLPPQIQEYVHWARQNPNNPKAIMILKKAGVR